MQEWVTHQGPAFFSRFAHQSSPIIVPGVVDIGETRNVFKCFLVSVELMRPKRPQPFMGAEDCLEGAEFDSAQH